mgnify:CR=1 FL=1
MVIAFVESNECSVPDPTDEGTKEFAVVDVDNPVTLNLLVSNFMTYKVDGKKFVVAPPTDPSYVLVAAIPILLFP